MPPHADQDRRDEAARKLAEAHFEIEEGISQIFRIRQSAGVATLPSEPIRLLEVNANTVPSGIMPIGFGPALSIGVPYSSVILEVTPEEFDRINAHELSLPPGWEIGPEILKPVATVLNGHP